MTTLQQAIRIILLERYPQHTYAPEQLEFTQQPPQQPPSTFPLAA